MRSWAKVTPWWAHAKAYSGQRWVWYNFGKHHQRFRFHHKLRNIIPIIIGSRVRRYAAFQVATSHQLASLARLTRVETVAKRLGWSLLHRGWGNDTRVWSSTCCSNWVTIQDLWNKQASPSLGYCEPSDNGQDLWAGHLCSTHAVTSFVKVLVDLVVTLVVLCHCNHKFNSETISKLHGGTWRNCWTKLDS